MGDDGTQERSSGLTSQLDQRRIDFLKADLKTCFTFVNLAATELEIGDLEAVRRVIAKAERGHETINRFLTDPKHASRISANQMAEFKAELRRLRRRLGGLKKKQR